MPMTRASSTDTLAMKMELKKKRSNPVGSGAPPTVIERENTEPKFSSVGVKTN